MEKILKDRTVFYLIILALILRLFLSLLPGFLIDVNDWFSWSLILNHFDFSHFYNRGFFADYTPGYLYILSLLGFIKNMLNLPNNLFYFLLKVPAIISELLIGLVVYIEAKRYLSKKMALFSLLFILFNPVLIFNSSVWGQIDAVLTLFLLLSVYFLNKNSLVLSSLFFGLALLVKPQAIAIIPVFFLYLFKRFSPGNILRLSLPFLVSVTLVSWPFFLEKPLIGLVDLIKGTAGQYPYTSLFAYNFWGVVGFWIKDSTTAVGVPYSWIGYVFLAVFWMLVWYFYFKKKLSVYTLSALATLSFFFLPTKVHERYLYPAIIFLVFSAQTLKPRLILLFTGILSLFHFLNLYYVYIYYNVFYYHLPNILYQPFVYNLLDGNPRQISFLSTVIFLLISISLIKYSDEYHQT